MMYPSPFMTLVVLASVTERIGLGTNTLVPLYHLCGSPMIARWWM
jgi:alkanesulfonate monooxygenase SsuD/methylene tetrahydromethanopterin reductase-like flavin-dependent oxidoreductase (luciferase family)